MPPLLGPGDSFNSSSATIRPDDHKRARPLPRAGAGLGPADSIGRELDAIINGQAGVLQSENGVGDNHVLENYFKNYHPAGAIDPNAALPANASASGSRAAPLARLPSEFDPLAFLNDPTGGAGGTFFDGLGIEPSSSSANAATNNAIGTELYRPTSSHSHRSHHSLSATDVDTDSGFYTTDMDTDDQDFDVGPSPGLNPVAELDTLNIGNTGFSPMSPYAVGSASASPAFHPATISPDADGLGRRRMSTTKRARTGPESGDGDEQRRVDRLEHRRSINRRSAQKHRLRRKEELETLSRQLAERDAKIALLEKDLAVTRAQLQQLISIMGPRLAASATAAPAAGAEKKE